MNRRDWLMHMGGLGTGLSLPWLGGCANQSSLRLGIHPWIGYEPLKLARSYRWLPEQVQLVETLDRTETATALQAGVVDAGCLTLDEVLRIRGLGVGLTVITVFDVSDGADVVLVRADIRRAADLRGKRIAMERGPLATLMYSGLLAQAQLHRSDLQIIYASPEQQLALWKNKEIDAAICYEPSATLMMREGAQRFFDSREMPDTIVDVLAIRNDRLHFPESTMHGLLQAHFKGLSHLRTHAEDANYRIAASQGIAPAEVRQALTGVVLPSLEANREYLAPDGRLQKAAQSLSERMVREQLLGAVQPLDNLVEARWLPGAST